jgi:GNAT superfamily N-acetyltransferase
MIFRHAIKEDIPQIQFVRNSVRENRLSNPSLVPDSDVHDYINRKGKGWVCVVDDHVVGFAIVSIIDHNVWALFIEPEFEKKGIGRRLHNEMMEWYFNQTNVAAWLGTAPGTRAEAFYRKAGWKEVGMHGKGEIKFEMTIDEWKRSSS